MKFTVYFTCTWWIYKSLYWSVSIEALCAERNAQTGSGLQSKTNNATVGTVEDCVLILRWGGWPLQCLVVWLEQDSSPVPLVTPDGCPDHDWDHLFDCNAGLDKARWPLLLESRESIGEQCPTTSCPRGIRDYCWARLQPREERNPIPILHRCRPPWQVNSTVAVDAVFFWLQAAGQLHCHNQLLHETMTWLNDFRCMIELAN